MILDYSYNKTKRVLSISYIKDNGMKALLNFNVNKFKSFYSTPNGQYTNWDGSKCNIKYVDNPHRFDIKTYIKEIPEEYRNTLNGKTPPKLYTFDIETEISDEFPDPASAKFPITTISIANENCDVIILGTKEMNDIEYLNNSFNEYLNNSKYYKSLKLSQPTIKYIKFESEGEMLKYFLQNIVAKVPALAGWNSIMFDWQYIQNRIRGYYPDISFNCCSINWNMNSKKYSDMRGETVRLSMPAHTLILDMMDVVGNFDMAVMPIKESLSLDYIASESIGMNKIKYNGDLQQLFDNDYPKYVFYNAIDSVLVQLIDKKFKTMNNIYAQSLVCGERIGSCFSKIAISEALFFNYFYDHNIKVVPVDTSGRERGVLVGAYVRKPTPGKHRFVCCNDFASLYPSTIITCNLSVENFVGAYYDEEALKPYLADTKNYIVVGGSVYKNSGTANKPSLGELECILLDNDALEPYRKDKNYFVTVNGHVYKNDKDYAFKEIQKFLKKSRGVTKYLSKQLDATVVSDIEHILNNLQTDNQVYSDNIQKFLKDNLLVTVEKTDDFRGLHKDTLRELHNKLKIEISYLTSEEQAYKLCGNSLYGGSSHVAFYWFAMSLANDITGEARNLIHKMESHIPEFFRDNWLNMKDLHEKLGIKVKN